MIIGNMMSYDGLKKSKYGVAVLSPNYIAEGKYWTKVELDGLFQLESINGKTILPIWHKLSKAQLINYSSKEIAKRQPLRAVFRDSSFSSSPKKINFSEIFKLFAPNTNVKVI